MDLFAFFKFYYFSITGNDKREELVNRSMLPILITPLALFIVHIIAGIVVQFHTNSMIVTYLLPIWIFIIIGNLIYSNSVRDSYWKAEQDRKDEARQKARRAKEAERMYRNWQEHARRKAENDRLEKERRERMYRNSRSNSSNNNQSRSNYSFNTNSNTSNRTSALSLMGLSDNPNEKEIKSAYRKLAKIHHPDLGGTQTNFVKLKKAYDYLMNK